MAKIELQEWLRIRDTKYVPGVRAEEDLRRNTMDGTPFGQALTEYAIRDILGRLHVLEIKVGLEQKKSQ